MTFEEFMNSESKIDKERIKRAVFIQIALKDKFGLDVDVISGDCAMGGTVGYVLVKIEEGSEKLVPIDVQVAPPVKEKIKLSSVKDLEEKYNQLSKNGHVMEPYLDMREVGIIVSFNSKRVFYYIEAKKTTYYKKPKEIKTIGGSNENVKREE